MDKWSDGILENIGSIISLKIQYSSIPVFQYSIIPVFQCNPEKLKI